MAHFRYQLMDAGGQRQQGELEAENEQSAMLALTHSDEVILELTEVVEKKQSKLSSRYQSVEVDTLLTFFNQFAFLMRSGLPLYQSLEMVIAQTENDYLRDALLDIRKNLVNGMSLSQAMHRHPKIFTDLYISMILVGEGSGKLDESFKRIVKIIEDERALKKKLKKVVNYVLFMVTIASVVMLGVLTFVFPKFAAIFSKVGMDLPLTTRMMITASDFIFDHVTTLPVVVIGLITMIVLFFKSSIGRVFLDHAKFKIPYVRHIVLEAALANFTRTLSSLLATGVPAIQALEISSEATTNVVMQPILRNVISDVRDGAKLTDAFSKYEVFPEIMIQLTAAGESSGQLDVMMENIHEYYKERVEESVARFTAIIEPLMLAVLGGMVLVMALSIFLPMFNLAGAVRR